MGAALSGEMVDAHDTFARRSSVGIAADRLADAVLGDQLAGAAAVTQAGATQLDTLAPRAQTIGLTAPTVTTPAAQRTVIAECAR